MVLSMGSVAVRNLSVCTSSTAYKLSIKPAEVKGYGKKRCQFRKYTKSRLQSDLNLTGTRIQARGNAPQDVVLAIFRIYILVRVCVYHALRKEQSEVFRAGRFFEHLSCVFLHPSEFQKRSRSPKRSRAGSSANSNVPTEPSKSKQQLRPL